MNTHCSLTCMLLQSIVLPIQKQPNYYIDYITYGLIFVSHSIGVIVVKDWKLIQDHDANVVRMGFENEL